MNYVVYDTYNNDLCRGVFDTAKEIGELLDISKWAVFKAVERGTLIHTRYRVEKIEIEERISLEME